MATDAEHIARLHRENAMLRAQVEILRGALVADDLDPIEIPKATPTIAKLTPSEAALVGALWRVYPKYLRKHDLEAALPQRDHAHDRDTRIVDVHVCRVRRKLGAEAVEGAWGRGLRLGEVLHKRLTLESSDGEESTRTAP